MDATVRPVDTFGMNNANVKITTKAITTDPWQFRATIFVNGVAVQMIHGDTSQSRADVRRVASEWMRTHWDNYRVLAALAAR